MFLASGIVRNQRLSRDRVRYPQPAAGGVPLWYPTNFASVIFSQIVNELRKLCISSRNGRYIADLTLGTGRHNVINSNAFYTNTNFLLALWKDLTELFQKQVGLLKKSIFW